MKDNSKRINKLGVGNALLTVFLLSTTAAVIWFIKTVVSSGWSDAWSDNWGKLIAIFLVEAVLFIAGISLCYLTSLQLGVKHRVIGAVFGLVPIVNLIVLGKIMSITFSEVSFEKAKNRLNKKRADQRICATKYPLLMVHGVFFRDFKYFNYWGRVPAELEKNGAVIHYGNHQSAASVERSAGELAARIKQIVEETGCEKVNVIAHSKGGLDTKYAIAKLGMAPYVASLTTINTPHKGCEFAEYLLEKAPEALKRKLAGGYNSALKKLGDETPDFMEAVTDLTASRCKEISDSISSFDFKREGVYTQSVGSWMKQASSGAFPLNMSYLLVKYFDGPNDGLVGEPSFHFGEDYTFLENKKSRRGISHGDMIDLNRANIKGFDVREFYVQLVAGLKNKGL